MPEPENLLGKVQRIYRAMGGNAPELTAHKLVGIVQFSRLPCPACDRGALIDAHGDVAGHADPADDKVCPEMEWRRRAAEEVTTLLDNVRAAYQAISDAPLQPDPPPVFTTRARAEAYEAWKREHDVTAWSDELGNSVHQMALEHVRKLDEMLAAMPIGYRLCLHDAEWMTAPDEQDYAQSPTIRMRIRQKAHMLGPDDTCLVTERRTEYGPKQ